MREAWEQGDPHFRLIRLVFYWGVALPLVVGSWVVIYWLVRVAVQGLRG